MDNLINKWKTFPNGVSKTFFSVDQIIMLAEEKRKKVTHFHYGTILILSITFFTITIFFYHVTYLSKTLSKIGIGIMLMGLLLRIIIELISIAKSVKIRLIYDISRTTSNALNFYKFRNKVHKPFTLSIVGFYMLGFYLLTPEITNYLGFKWIILIDLCFALICGFLISQIRKGIKNELKHLAEISLLHEAMQSIN